MELLSHGHFDHFAGLVNILKRMLSSPRQTSNHSVDIFTYPDAFLRRWESFLTYERRMEIVPRIMVISIFLQILVDH
jgi:metal-dependent hydrolase (beta-lactamase superfamily II)